MMAKSPYTKRYKLMTLKTELDSDFNTFKSHYQDIAEYFQPRRYRQFMNEVNRGDKQNQKIIDTTPMDAGDTLRSGMTAGIMGPSRPWFRLTFPNQQLAESGAVKEWLHFNEQTMNTVFLKSNLYENTPIMFGDTGYFGTAAMLAEKNSETLLNFHSFPVGTYRLAKNARGRINTFFRDFGMTVSQLIEKFGYDENKPGEIQWDRFSNEVKMMYEQQQRQKWVQVCHAIYPNDDYKPNSLLPKHKKFASCYYETGSMAGSKSYITEMDNDRYLRESGYDYFPILAPRWDVAGEDVYGTNCPGMKSLGANKALQLMWKRKAQAVEHKVNPSLQAPAALEHKVNSALPGDWVFLDSMEMQMGGIKRLFDVNFETSDIREDILDHQKQINRAFHADLFRKVIDDERNQRATAAEIAATQNEQLVVLGPTLERFNQDVGVPLIDIAFYEMEAAGLVPEPPEEIKGMPIKVDFISIVAQAQKLSNVGSLERYFDMASRMAAVFPDSVHKTDSQQFMDVYGDTLSIPPAIVRTDEAVAEIEQRIAQQQQAAAMAENVPAMTGAAKDLADADLSGDNALSRLLSNQSAGGSA